MSDNMRELRLPAQLCELAEQRFATDFPKVEQLLEFVLSELLRDDAAQIDEAEQRVIDERLRQLGYL